MHSFTRNLRRLCLALVCLAALLYVADDLWARHRGRPTEQVKVDVIYAAENHFNEVEFSVGKQEIQTCLDALLPHFGYKPCWYLRRHTLQQIGNP